MRDLTNKVAWITGAGTGIGEGTALAYARAGMRLVLSGRRQAELDKVAAQVAAIGRETGNGASARVAVLDVADKDAVAAVAASIQAQEGRLDVLVNSAGLNVRERNWKHLSTAGWDQVLRIDLDGTFYCCHAALPMMRAQKDGLIINVSSWAGRFVGTMTGPAYSAAKFGVNAMTESLNMEECIHGIRATAVCPGEVATPILDKRPIPVSAEDKAKMVQAADCGALMLFLAQMPAHVCLNEVTISPTWNRGFVAAAQAIPG
jgi:NAD(P)-dependent dehydrogenase (short-subunit alcohol dehydrogenase family)